LLLGVLADLQKSGILVHVGVVVEEVLFLVDLIEDLTETSND
jgi:hypothetical protein